MDRILISIKRLLGIAEEYDHFDQDLVIYINSAFSVLTQLGVGPPEGFSIRDANAVWSDFLEENPRLEVVKSYIGLKVRLLFDPPASATAIESLNRLISEFEWRINTIVEAQKREEEIQNE